MQLLLVAVVVIGLLALAVLWVVKVAAVALSWVALVLAVTVVGSVLGVVCLGLEGVLERRRAKR